MVAHHEWESQLANAVDDVFTKLESSSPNGERAAAMDLSKIIASMHCAAASTYAAAFIVHRLCSEAASLHTRSLLRADGEFRPAVLKERARMFKSTAGAIMMLLESKVDQ